MSNAQTLTMPPAFFRALGGLHDARINGVNWDALSRRVTIVVDDLNASFDGLPEYLGKRPASIIFDAVANLHLDCNCLELDRQRIYELDVHAAEHEEKLTLSASISPSGLLSFTFESVYIVDTLAGIPAATDMQQS